jgi:hypothetical protein
MNPANELIDTQRGESHSMVAIREGASTQSDALVFFGATGDLAYKKIFPALQHSVLRREPCNGNADPR